MSDEFSPTWEEWFWSTVFPNPASWVMDRSGESQFYLIANLGFTSATVLANTAYQYYFGSISAEAIALHGSRFNAAGYAATGSPSVYNTLRVLRNAPPWLAAGAASSMLDENTDFYSRIHTEDDPFIESRRASYAAPHLIVRAYNYLR